MKAPIETCQECGFDGAEWSTRDTVNTLPHLGGMAELAITGANEAVLTTPPDTATWSIAQYIDHMREVMFGNRFMAEMAHQQPAVDLGHFTDLEGADTSVDLDAALVGLKTEARELWEFVRGLNDEEWSRHATLDGVDKSIGWIARHVIHDLFHHYGDIAGIRHRLGDTVNLSGTVTQVSASVGGVPKLEVPEAEVTRAGIPTDTQAARQHHGRPWQALCLYSADVIAALQAEGHSIHAGASGENITVGGIEWTSLRAGLRVTIGDMVCRLTTPAVPCSKNNQWFADGKSSRIDHAKHPGWSRWYAEVRQSGTIAAGDAVSVSSPG